MVAADVSAEHFIANAGVAYRYGIVPATGSWNTWIIYSLFLWIFLPYYVRTGLYTVPQFLERRYNVACRYIFSGSLIAGYVAAIIAGSLFAGGVALDSMLGLPVTLRHRLLRPGDRRLHDLRRAEVGRVDRLHADPRPRRRGRPRPDPRPLPGRRASRTWSATTPRSSRSSSRSPTSGSPSPACSPAS